MPTRSETAPLLRPAPSVAEWLAAPMGRWVAGPSWALFVLDERLAGVQLRGRLSTDDARELARLLEKRLGEQKPFLFDDRRLSSVDPGAFLVFAQFARERAATKLRARPRLAIVFPEGIIAAVALGFLAHVRLPFDARAFGEVPDALRFLGRVDDAPAIAESLDRMHEEASGESPELRAVRALIAQDLGGADLRRVARAIGTSPRTLQRTLRRQGTSLQLEQRRAQLHRAMERLARTDDPVTTIAIEVGCASVQVFGTMFKKETGLTPTDWRARHRVVDEG